MLDAFFNSQLTLTAIILVPTLVYLTAGFRTAYRDGLGAAVLRGVGSLLLLFLVLTIYRGILFFVVFWTV